MRRASTALLITMLASGCSAILDFGDSQLIDAGRGGGDAGADAGDAGADARADARAGADGGVVCGGSLCTLPDQQCCITGGTPSCQAVTATCAGQVVRCDGPEDCTGAQVCCAQVPASFILCRPYGAALPDCDGVLTGSSGKLVLCHHSADCPSDRPVCQECPGQTVRFCEGALGAGCTAE